MLANVGVWATANTRTNNNTGNLTVTGNWSSSGTITGLTDGSRGNVVNNNTVVTNGSWPSGAQSVMAAAGVQGSSGGGQSNVMIVGGQSGRCVDVNGGSATNGAQAQLWDCSGGTNQRWTYTAGKQLTAYGSKCLDAYNQGSTNGTQVVIWDCNGQANQQWSLRS